uniref:Insulin-like domain-containing protein n=1 Tax=Plectus sambesii TaxID=2011161 RepID=A0A914VL55_9BILA
MFWLYNLCIIILASSQYVADGSRQGQKNFGSLKLCPAGGASFVEAWSMACTMRRKKRNVELEEGQDTRISDQFRFNSNHAGRPMSLKQNDGRHALVKRSPQQKYRPATLTEIMRICCVHGCELVDLWAYCDPFGPWDS